MSSAAAIPVLQIEAADGARAAISAHGAHLTSWIPHGGDEQLFLSSRSQIGPGLAIRGGVPVIFPQFASEGPLSKHGFARALNWAQRATGRDDDGRAYARFTLQDSATTRAAWPHAFSAELQVLIGGDALEIQLRIDNTGDTPFSFTAALHSYLRVSDIAGARVHGLAGLRYRDSADGNHLRDEHDDALAIVGEVDRIYFNAPPSVTLSDGPRRLAVQSRGFRDLVVWNPGEAKAAALADLDPGGWRHLLCLEAATIGVPVSLAAADSWTGAQILRLG